MKKSLRDPIYIPCLNVTAFAGMQGSNYIIVGEGFWNLTIHLQTWLLK